MSSESEGEVEIIGEISGLLWFENLSLIYVHHKKKLPLGISLRLNESNK